jgi:hypothetical protein
MVCVTSKLVLPIAMTSSHGHLTHQWQWRDCDAQGPAGPDTMASPLSQYLADTTV